MSIPSINPHVWIPIADRTLTNAYGPSFRPIWELIDGNKVFVITAYSVDHDSSVWTHYRLVSFGEVAPPPKTREDLDREAFATYWEKVVSSPVSAPSSHDLARNCFIDGLKDGRIEARKALAKRIKKAYAENQWHRGSPVEEVNKILAEAAQ